MRLVLVRVIPLTELNFTCNTRHCCHISWIQWYRHAHAKDMPLRAIARLIQTMLYAQRFFPYYVYNILGGIEDDGASLLSLMLHSISDFALFSPLLEITASNIIKIDIQSHDTLTSGLLLATPGSFRAIIHMISTGQYAITQIPRCIRPHTQNNMGHHPDPWYSGLVSDHSISSIP